ncbi:hypothetical protein M316_0024 [Nitrincola phage 1M3-16]|uniref:hypothetical protein n=1 Tax=Nitrincola phage 1M3-16 TaxID=1472912 RepID=UPI000444AB7C|nr:hypothetical protein GJ22_gp128 [Nitrincola phage 1M3-16]AHX01089.1 hypothetical protein M316_0024 [Nitrincola phage 1M3-16]
MIYLLVVVLIVGWVVGLAFLFDKSFGSRGWMMVLILYCTLSLAGLLMFLGSQDSKPCARYESIMQYNPATKTMMPMKVCVQYGEWEE